MPPLHSIAYANGQCLIAGRIIVQPWLTLDRYDQPVLAFRVEDNQIPSRYCFCFSLPDAIDEAMARADRLVRLCANAGRPLRSNGTKDED